MPSAARPPRLVTRRGILVGGTALAVLGVATSCSGQSQQAKRASGEELRKPFEQARSDSALATAAATAVGIAPQIAAALTVVATQRNSHATSLAAEMFRVGKTTSPTSTTPASATASDAEPPPPPSVDDVITALRAAADTANELVSNTSGYRAGLLGSIAASCTASCSVALVPGGPSI